MKTTRDNPVMPTSSMADIAFLLLIFFLVTTTIASDTGLPVVLPPEARDNMPHEIHERNVLAIRINSQDRVMVENEVLENTEDLSDKVLSFILNHGRDPRLSDSPEEAVISIKTDRAASQKEFIHILDEVHHAYNTMYAQRLDITEKEWLTILSHLSDPANRRLYELAKGIQSDGRSTHPMQISIADQ